MLPSFCFEIEEYHEGNIRKDGCVRFRGKYYSVGKEKSRKNSFCYWQLRTIKIYFKGNLLETHKKIASPYQSKSIKNHHLEPYEQIINNGEHYLNQGGG